jgi:hypothetical protein
VSSGLNVGCSHGPDDRACMIFGRAALAEACSVSFASPLGGSTNTALIFQLQSAFHMELRVFEDPSYTLSKIMRARCHTHLGRHGVLGLKSGVLGTHKKYSSGGYTIQN